MQVDDDTGLTSVGARQYDASIGRFVSVDPILDATDPQQALGYTYANDNPVTYSDPTGLLLGIPAGGPINTPGPDGECAGPGTCWSTGGGNNTGGSGGGSGTGGGGSTAGGSRSGGGSSASSGGGSVNVPQQTTGPSQAELERMWAQNRRIQRQKERAAMAQANLNRTAGQMAQAIGTGKMAIVATCGMCPGADPYRAPYVPTTPGLPISPKEYADSQLEAWRATARWLWTNGQASGSVCVGGCVGVSFQNGVFGSSFGAWGFGGWGTFGGVTSEEPADQGSWSFMGCVSYVVGACGMGGPNSDGDGAYVGGGVAFGEGAVAGGFWNQPLLDFKNCSFSNYCYVGPSGRDVGEFFGEAFGGW